MDFERPPSAINPCLNPIYDRVPLCKVVKGDHIRNYDEGLQDSIVVSPVSKGQLQVVTATFDGGDIIPTYRAIPATNILKVEILKYACRGDSSTWVKTALKASKDHEPLKDVTNPSAFIMRYKIGHDIEWKKCTISQLNKGDHIIAEKGNHGIIDETNLRLTKICYYTWEKDRALGTYSVLRKEWFKATKQIQKAIYNTCCTNTEALSNAKRLAELKDTNHKFKDSQEFARFCKSGYTAFEHRTKTVIHEDQNPPEVRHIEEASLSTESSLEENDQKDCMREKDNKMEFQRPPSHINPDLHPSYERIPLYKAVKGDHIRNYDESIPDSIVMSAVSKGRLEVVTTELKGDGIIPTYRDMQANGIEVEILKYPCNGNSSTWVQTAFEAANKREPIKETTHPSAFIMKCKIGHDIEWQHRTISQLVKGDHIIADQGNHGIVARINLRLATIVYFTWEKNSIIEKAWKGFSAKKHIPKANYNTCCTNVDALNCAVRLTQQKDAASIFKDSEEFARFCRFGYTEQPIKSDNCKIQYPPKERDYNQEVITSWDEKHISDILRGDHVYSKKAGLTHCLVEKKIGNTLHVICCIEENGKTEIRRLEKLMTDIDIIQVARYETSKDSGSTLKKAISLLGTKRADEFKDNPVDFVTLCKRGEEIEWKTCFINQLVRGDHIKWGINDKNHGIVKYVSASEGRVLVVMYTYGGVKTRPIYDATTFLRAVYNSCYEPDTVLKLSESRIGERRYHPLDNDDFDFAKWCKTGKLKAPTSKKELVLSSDMLKPGDLISWTRMLTYDHYALVKQVLGPNLIEVFEFTTRTGNKMDGKSYKRRAKLQIFDGYDPVYKITQTPPENPEVLIEEAKRQEGEIGGYHPLHNNCENFATGSKQKYASQARAFCHWLKGVGLNCTAESLTSPFAGLFNAGDVSDAVNQAVTDAVIKLKSSAGSALGVHFGVHSLKHLNFGLNGLGLLIPFPIEFMMIMLDINHGWENYKKTRIITGLVGTSLTSIAISAIAFSICTAPFCIGMFFLSIVIGITGSAITQLTRRSIRRKIDQWKCRKAFKGLYTNKPLVAPQDDQDITPKDNLDDLEITSFNHGSDLWQPD